MLYHAKRAKGEVGGFGVVLKDDDNPAGVRNLRYLMHAATLPKQDVEASIFDPAPFEMLKFIDDNYERPTKDASTVALWWHSHANMQPTPSARDHKTIANLATLGYIVITLIINKRGDHTCRMDFDLCGMPLAYRMDVVKLIPPFFTKKQSDALDAEFDTQVTEWTHQQPRPSALKRVTDVARGSDRLAKAALEALKNPDEDDAEELGLVRRGGVAGRHDTGFQGSRHGFGTRQVFTPSQVAAVKYAQNRRTAMALMNKEVGGGNGETNADEKFQRAMDNIQAREATLKHTCKQCHEELSFQAEIDEDLCISCQDDHEFSQYGGWYR